MVYYICWNKVVQVRVYYRKESGRMNVYEIQTWTFDFVERNETECANYAVSLQNDALSALKSKNFSKASEMFHNIVRGMGILSAIDKDFYEPPYSAACFHLAKIEAFGLKNTKEARHYLEIACDHAASCAKPGRPTAQTAERDLEMMKAMLEEFEKGVAVADIAGKFGIGAPYSFSGKSKSGKSFSKKGTGIDFLDQLVGRLSPNARKGILIAVAVLIVVVIVICIWPEDEPKTDVLKMQEEQRQNYQETKHEPKEEEDMAYVNSENGLNVRKEPSTDSEILGKLMHETPVTILEKKDGWVKIKYVEEGGWGSGWCKGDYIKSAE